MKVIRVISGENREAGIQINVEIVFALTQTLLYIKMRQRQEVLGDIKIIMH
jgi:hypothetical protein